MPDPTLILVTTTAALPREGEGAALIPAGAVRRYQNALNEQGKRLVEIHRKLSDREVELVTIRDELNGRISWLARIEAAAKDVFALRYMANMTLDTAIYKLWLATEGTPSIYSPVVIPTAPSSALVAELAKRDEAETKNAALLRQNEFLHGLTDDQQGEIAFLRAELAKRDETIADLRSQVKGWADSCSHDLETIAELEAKNATQGEMIAGQADTIGRLQADYNAVCSDIDEERQRNENQRRSLEEDARTITSLRTQLTRAGAIEAAAREVVDSHDSTTLDGALVDSAKLADLSELFGPLAPSPGPRGTPEGERAELHSQAETLRRLGEAMRVVLEEYRGETWSNTLHTRSTQALAAWADSQRGGGTPEGESREGVAKRYQAALNEQGLRSVEVHRKLEEAKARLVILERVAIHAKSYMDHDGRTDRYERRNALLTALDALEATPCPSP